MKRLLTLLFASLAFILRGADTSDLDPGLDPTGLGTISAAQLLQMVQQATVKNNTAITNGKGIIWRSTIQPDVSANPRMTNWIWIDLSAGYPGILRQYVSGSWMAQPAGTIYATNIAPGSVNQAALATNAVDTINIINNAVTSAKIAAGAVLNTQLGVGVVSNANIADLTIQSGKIAYNTILATNIADGAITGPKLAAGTITGTQLANYSIDNTKLATNAVGRSNIIAGAVGPEALTNSCVSTNNISITGGTAYQVLQIDMTSSFVGWANPVIRSNVVLNVGSNLTSAGVFTVAHGLGVRPTFIRVVLTNAVSEFNWQVGDEVEWSIHDDGTSGMNAGSDASNIYIAHTSGFGGGFDRSTGNRSTFTPGKWGWRAYVFR